MPSSPWGHDWAWERAVVEQIRRGGAAPQIDSAYAADPYLDRITIYTEGWELAEELSRDAVRTGAAYLNDEAIAKRAAQRKLLRQGVREAMAENAAKRAKAIADNRARDAASADEQRAWKASQEKRQRLQREQDEAWQAEAERIRIMTSKWVCTICNGASAIERKNDGYQITCSQCGKTAFGSHASLWKVVK